MKGQKIRLCVLLVLAAIAVVSSMIRSAQADKRIHADPDDSTGGFDIESVKHRHENRGLLVHRVTTYEDGIRASSTRV